LDLFALALADLDFAFAEDFLPDFVLGDVGAE